MRLAAGRERGEPGDPAGTGVVDRHAGGRGVGRTARDAGIRKVGGSGSELELADVEPEAVRRDLSQRGRGALAHVVRPDLHDAAAVSAQYRLGLRLEHERRNPPRAHAPADEQSVMIAHLPGRELSALPTET